MRMLRKLWGRLLHDRQGGMYVDSGAFVLILVMGLALALSVFAVNWRKTSAQDFADYAARQISADGAFSGSTVQKLTSVAGSGYFSVRVKTDDGYDVTVPISTSQAGYTQHKIQLGTSYSVYIMSLDANVIGVGGVKTDSVSVTGQANGTSMRYWKG